MALVATDIESLPFLPFLLLLPFLPLPGLFLLSSVRWTALLMRCMGTKRPEGVGGSVGGVTYVSCNHVSKDYNSLKLGVHNYCREHTHLNF